MERRYFGTLGGWLKEVSHGTGSMPEIFPAETLKMADDDYNSGVPDVVRHLSNVHRSVNGSLVLDSPQRRPARYSNGSTVWIQRERDAAIAANRRPETCEIVSSTEGHEMNRVYTLERGGTEIGIYRLKHLMVPKKEDGTDTKIEGMRAGSESKAGEGAEEKGV